MKYAATGLAAIMCLSSAGADETIKTTGLREPVEIRVDRWGIAHIRATNEDDLFFAQGYNAARDRMFQLEMWRRLATGTTAEIIGERGLNRDIGARLHRYRGDIGEELSHYHPRGEAIVGAFVRGINAWIERTEDDPGLLPLEFRLLGIKPGRWTPEIVVSRHQGLFGNLTQELALARASIRSSPALVKEWNFFHPGDPDLTIDPQIPAEALLDPDITKLYEAFREPLRFEKADLVAEFRSSSEAIERLATIESEDPNIGSNNWVVSGRLSESGHPLLANDPHRVLQAPSLRYFVHLTAPGWNVIGGGEPTLPGVSIGHNEHGAWGLTIFRTDMEDLMVYETDPANHGRYRYRGNWEMMEIVQETIQVKGKGDVKVELKYTRHGPVLHEDPKRHLAFALRAAWLEKGCAPYLASLRIDQAESWAEFRQACAFHHAPPLNMVWADRGGDVGWQVSAITPVRRGWSGLVPVPGDGSCEWDGFLPIPLLPHLHNPASGFWATANEHLTPADYPYPEVIGFTWSDPYRGDRLREAIGSAGRIGVTDMMALQQDVLCLPAKSLTPLLKNLALSPAATAARERLLAWDYEMTPESFAAGIYAAWEKRLETELREKFVPEPARKDIGSLSRKRLVEWLTAPDGRFGENPAAGRDAVLIASLEEADSHLSQKLGSDLEKWRYGQSAYKHARIRHALGGAVDDATRDQLEPGPLPRGGNGQTVNNSGDEDNQPTGATFRIVIDTADWDRAAGTNSPGQSGDPASPHYRDLFEPWATGEYFPLLYSAEKVDGATENTIRLVPGR
jgi:penicillin amidase